MRASVRVSVVVHKKEKEKKDKRKEGASLSAPKVEGKGAPKRKTDKKDDRPIVLLRKHQLPLGRSNLRSRRLPSQAVELVKA